MRRRRTGRAGCSARSGPGTKLPDARATRRTPRCATRTPSRSRGLIDGGADAVLVETAQDLLQAKAAVIGARRALDGGRRRRAADRQVTVETTGTMLLGSEIGAALTALEPLGIDVIGLNCATGPAEMSEHLRHLSRHARRRLACMPNAGLPVLDRGRRALPADARPSWPTRTTRSPASTAWPWSAAAAARRPSTCGRSSSGSRGRDGRDAAAAAASPASRRSTSTCRSGRTPRTCRSASAPTPTAPRRSARRCSTSGWDDCVEIARDQIRDGAHLLDVCVDYVGRDGVADMQRGRQPARHRVDAAARARLDRARRLRGRPGAARRPRVVNSVNFEDGDGPDSRFARIMPLVARARRRRHRADHRRGGPGPHRRAQGARSPSG